MSKPTPARERQAAAEQKTSMGVNQPGPRQAIATKWAGIDQSRQHWQFPNIRNLFSPNPRHELGPAIRRGEAVFVRIDTDYKRQYARHSGSATLLVGGQSMPLTSSDGFAFCGFEGMPRDDDDYTKEHCDIQFVGLATDDFSWDDGKTKGFADYFAGAMSAWNTSNQRLETGELIRWCVPKKDVHYKLNASNETIPLYKLNNSNQFGGPKADWHMPAGIEVVQPHELMTGQKAAHAKVAIGGEGGQQIEVMLLDAAALADIKASNIKKHLAELPTHDVVVSKFFRGE
jgi:hypothetical protein